jgi:hypothetical protein
MACPPAPTRLGHGPRRPGAASGSKAGGRVGAPPTRGGCAGTGWGPAHAHGARDGRAWDAWQPSARRWGVCRWPCAWPADGGRPSVPRDGVASGAAGGAGWGPAGGLGGRALGAWWGSRRVGRGSGCPPEPSGLECGSRARPRCGASRGRRICVRCLGLGSGAVAAWRVRRGVCQPLGGPGQASGRGGGGQAQRGGRREARSVVGHRACPRAGRGAHPAPNKRLQATSRSRRCAPASGRA